MLNLITYTVTLSCFLFISNIKCYNSNRNSDASDVSHLKRELYLRLLDEINVPHDNDFKDSNLNEHLSQADEHDDSEYKQFFGYLLQNADQIADSDSQQDDDSDSQFVESSYVEPYHNTKQKRFLKSLFDKLKPKNKTANPIHIESESEDEPTPKTNKPTASSKSTSKMTSTSKSNVPIVTSNTAATDDAFYKLKTHCQTNFDQLCSSKRKEMFDLVQRCEKLQFESNLKQIEACRDVLSIYCYVYYSRDLFTCFGGDYEKYVPGSKKFTTKSTPTVVTTASTRRISIITVNPITTTKPTTTTTKSTTTTTRTTPKAAVTTKAAITTKPSAPTKPTAKPASPTNDLVSPFDGPVTSVPNDAEKLKKIGNYCLKIKTKDANCDKTLTMLKNKFKACEKMPKTDKDCQTFKISFCTAYTNFPCCPDVLAGRTCAGKANSKRNVILNM